MNHQNQVNSNFYILNRSYLFIMPQTVFGDIEEFILLILDNDTTNTAPTTC